MLSFYVLLVAVILCMFMSLRTLFIPTTLKHKRLSFRDFIYLGFAYATLVIGFGLIYMLFQVKGHDVLYENGKVLTGGFFEHMETSFYFSAMTLFSVGYGDVVPIGIGRLLAIFEALIGYSLPAAFVARTVFDMEKSE